MQENLLHVTDTDPWPPTLDALIAAPAQHTLLFEDDKVRVLDTRIAPRERTPMHTHQWPAVHPVISWSAFVRRDHQDAVLLDTRTVGTAVAAGAMLWGERWRRTRSRTWGRIFCTS